MKQTIAAIFASPMRANEAVHVLLKAGFAAERRPSIAGDAERTSTLRLRDAIGHRLHELLGADATLSPYTQALAAGHFVVKVQATHDAEAAAARRILEIAGDSDVDGRRMA